MKVRLTDEGKKYIMEHYPQGIVWEYDPAGEFELHSIISGREVFVELTYIGVPYRIPSEIKGQLTFEKVEE